MQSYLNKKQIKKNYGQVQYYSPLCIIWKVASVQEANKLNILLLKTEIHAKWE